MGEWLAGGHAVTGIIRLLQQHAIAAPKRQSENRLISHTWARSNSVHCAGQYRAVPPARREQPPARRNYDPPAGVPKPWRLVRNILTINILRRFWQPERPWLPPSHCRPPDPPPPASIAPPSANPERFQIYYAEEGRHEKIREIRCTNRDRNRRSGLARQHRLWRGAGYPPVKIAVNISATQFIRSNLAEKVAEVLAAHEMEPRYLELELTEGVLMRDAEDTARQISELRALGVRICIDDFGTGYSSLGYLQRLPIDDLKIDKCFVQGIERAASTQPLVRAIIGLAHGLNLTATAEGVETENELAVLRTLGCDQVQGFLLGRPAPVDQWENSWQAGALAPA